MNCNRLYFVAASCCWVISLVGCSNKPAGVSIPDWDPPAFAGAVIERLDKNGDSLVDKGELPEAPGLAFGARFIDTNSDGKLSSEELESRFAKYRERKLGLTSQQFRVTYNGRPLVGATVRLVPEFFLSETIEPAEGTTVGQGMLNPSIAGQKTPLMRVGYYRVEVTSPNVTLPAKFNSATTVGVEVSPFPSEPADSGMIEIQLLDK
jgi:EF hand